MSDHVTPSPEALKEALALSHELLRNVELSELALEALCLKASRLARLLNDSKYRAMFEFEAQGYPMETSGVPAEAYRLAQLAGREFDQKNGKTGKVEKYIFGDSVGSIEATLEASKLALASCADPNVSISSANPRQHVSAPMGNFLERQGLLNKITSTSRRLASRRTLIHAYASEKNLELKFSSISADIFSRLRERVDASIGGSVPDAVNKFNSVYENMASNNPEDWSNAVHSCRRILQALADAVLPPQADRVSGSGKNKITVRLGADNYINRLVAFCEDHSSSERHKEIVGSHLRYIGDRLDAVFAAAQKGSHHSVSREEADRYVICTYILVGELLALLPAQS